MSRTESNKTSIIIALIICVSGLLAFVYWEKYSDSTTGTPQQAPLKPMPTLTPAIAVAPPSVELENDAPTPEEVLLSENEPELDILPIIQSIQEPAVTLPRLNESDVFLAEQLAPLVDSSLLSILVPDELIRKLVRAIIGISENKLVTQYRPIISPLPPLGIDQSGSIQSPRYMLAEENYQRYNAYLTFLKVITPEALVSLYHRLEPLFEEAYAEQGLGGTFKPVLIKAINNMLTEPVAEGKLWLVRPAVMYRYADPAIELLPDTQKLFLRMGPEHTKNIQRYLTELKAKL